jgi:hypothetical protein
MGVEGGDVLCLVSLGAALAASNLSLELMHCRENVFFVRNALEL